MSVRLPLLVAVALVCLGGATGPATATHQNASASNEVEISALYPNPVATGDAGEFVVLDGDGPISLAEWSIADEQTTVSLPNETVSGRVVLSTAPNRTRNLTADPVYSLPGAIALANEGETVELRRHDHTTDTVSYDDAPSGEVAESTTDGLTWRPLGATDFPVIETGPGRVRTFVLPDGAAVPAETLSAADERILLAGYTLTSDRVVRVLTNASERGVDVRVLVDSSPVGGLGRREATALDRLRTENVSVSVIGGEGSRYGFHHAKYAVVDDRALVTTENWKPAGTGGRASRGWGVVVHRQSIVESLAETFRADAGWRDASRWSTFRADRQFEAATSPPANGSYPTRFHPRRLSATRIELLLAPDNAEGRVVTLLDGATESIAVQQVSIGDPDQPFLRAALRAASRGVDVHILLSDAWYVREDNRELVDWVNDLAARRDLPLEARIASPRGRFEKIHAKGVVVDGDQVLVGSMNWNNHSARENREVALLLDGEAVGEYYASVFRADWRGGIWRFPVGVAAAVGLGLLGALVVARRIEFGNRQPVRPAGEND